MKNRVLSLLLLGFSALHAMEHSKKVPSLVELALPGVARLLDHNIKTTQCTQEGFAETLKENAQVVAGIEIANKALIQVLEENLARIKMPYYKVRVLQPGCLAVALSADGTQCASGSYDGTVRLWDMHTETPPKILKGHTGCVDSVALSADGKQCASGSVDGTVRFWDIKAGESKIFKGGTGYVCSVALSADGTQCASGSDDKIVRVWDMQADTSPKEFKGHTGVVHSVTLSADGTQCASASDGTVRLWNIKTGECKELKGDIRAVNSVALSANGMHCVSPCRDKTVQLWDIESDTPPKILQGHTDWVCSVALSADGTQCASGSYDGTVRLWDMQADAPSQILAGHTYEGNSVALSADGTHCVSGSSKGIIVWSRVYNAYSSLLYALAQKAETEKAQITLSASEQPEWSEAYARLATIDDPETRALIKQSITLRN